MQTNATKRAEAVDPTGVPANLKSISEMASRYGVTLRTLRFYEERGLLSSARVGLARYYSAMDEVRLQVILKGRKLGFSLAEVETFVHSAKQQNLMAADEPALPLSDTQIAGRLAALEEDRTRIALALDELYRAKQKLG